MIRQAYCAVNLNTSMTNVVSNNPMQTPYLMKPINHFLRLTGLLVLLAMGLLPHLAGAVDISVSVDRNPVTMDESFKIYFTASDNPDGEPDFSALEQDFSVLNQSQSSNTSWVNGEYSKTIRWTVEAMAKKSGKLDIPGITFGSDTSKPLSIEVSDKAANNNGVNPNDDLFLQVKVSSDQPFVQSQVIYTVRVYRRVEITQASLGEPELTDAVVEKLSQDSEFNTVVNGVSYLVTERKYAIFPQKSGEMTIKPITLTADVVVDSNGGRGGFGGFFGSPITHTKRVLSEEIKLNVKPVPASFKGKAWLVADQLKLTQEWSGDNQQMKVGEPLTRTLTLKGEGTAIGQLPELNGVKTDANLKAYPDQPVLNEQKLPSGIVSSRQEKIAIIPAKPGKHTLPAIEIPWFNTETQQMEMAKLPETTVTVLGEVVENPPAVPVSPAKPQVANPTQTETVTAITPSPTNATVANNPTIWIWVSVFLGLGWLITLAYFLLRQTKIKPDENQSQHHTQQELRLKDISNQLKQACCQNDSQAAKNALLAWGNQQFNANNLGTIAHHCDVPLRDEIMNLNAVLYGKNAEVWQGNALFQAFNGSNKDRLPINQSRQSLLEPLHRL
jgi:BatD DUF11 like domain